VLNRDPLRYHYGIVKEFDYSIGHGIILSDDKEEYTFHFSAIVGRLIKLAWQGERVCFELIHDEEEDFDTAFNITFPTEKQNKISGKIVWFDKKTGNGVIESDDGQECIIQKNSFPEELITKLKKDVVVKFLITQVESIEGEFIPKAVSLELDN
jgi:cold shock CspA family protein